MTVHGSTAFRSPGSCPLVWVTVYSASSWVMPDGSPSNQVSTLSPAAALLVVQVRRAGVAGAADPPDLLALGDPLPDRDQRRFEHVQVLRLPLAAVVDLHPVPAAAAARAVRVVGGAAAEAAR